MNCFRVDYCGRGELADRQQKLNQFLAKLTHMAEGCPSCLLPPPTVASNTDEWTAIEFNVCVLMVCHYLPIGFRRPGR